MIRDPKLRSRTFLTVSIFLICLLLTSGLLIRLLKDMDWRLFQRFGWIDILWLLFYSATGTASYSLSIYVLIRSLGYRTSVMETYLVLTASLSANYISFIKAGLPIRIFLYKRIMKIPVDKGTALIAIETLIGVFLTTAIAIIGCISNNIDIAFGSSKLAFQGIIFIFILTGILVIWFIKTDSINISRFSSNNFISRIIGFIDRIRTGLRYIPNHAVVVTTLLSGVNLFSGAMRLQIILRVLGYDLSPVLLLYAIAMSVTAGNFSFIPMGLGIRDASLTLILLNMGISRPVAVSVALIQRLFAPGWPLMLGLISINILGLKQFRTDKDDHNHDEINDHLIERKKQER